MISIIVYNWDWADKPSGGKPFRALRDGLKNIGEEVSVCIPPGDGLDDCSALFVWNASKRDWYNDKVAAVRAKGGRVFVMERGWFDRMNYTQFDYLGFNHTASWAHKVSGPAPVDGHKRFRMLCELLSEPKPVIARPEGYVLILGQTGNDTQLRQSEIHHPDALCGSVIANLPAGLEAVYRPHPLSQWRPGDLTSMEGPLDDALAGARFVITINSNAGNDALWAGIPVLCFGPALYEIAGVARRTSIATLMSDMEFMCIGWKPDERRVLSYFHWLASRQWNRAELEQGDCLKQLIGEYDAKN